MIEAYCGRQSYANTDLVDLHVSTDAASFELIIIRSGLDEVEMLRLGAFQGVKYATPVDVVENGCQWPVAISITPQVDWKSGFYKIKLLASDGSEGEAFFVLRAGNVKAKILWVIETNTWNAYNFYGGKSTYTADGMSYAGGANRVSFQRPLPKGFITLPADHARLGNAGVPGDYLEYGEWAAQNDLTLWTGAASWSQWGTAFAQWLEKEGIEVDYATSGDLEFIPGLLDEYRLLLSIGHDEYWSWGMRDAVEAFFDRGGNGAFLSGNTSYWQVRLEQDGQQMVSYKSKVNDDPVLGTADERKNTGIWSNRLTARPENQMTGLSFTRGGYARIGKCTPRSSGGYTIYRPNHWALEGTGLQYGDCLGAASYLIAYECDGCELQFNQGLPYPTGKDGTPLNFEIIAIAPAALITPTNAPPGLYPEGELTDIEVVSMQVAGNRDPDTMEKYSHGHAVLGSYVTKGGGTVFSSGTTEWAFALSEQEIATITRNIINKLS